LKMWITHYKYVSLQIYEGVFKSFRTGCLERELQIVQLSATRCGCIAILWVSLVKVFFFLLQAYISLSTQSGNFLLHTRISVTVYCNKERRIIDRILHSKKEYEYFQNANEF